MQYHTLSCDNHSSRGDAASDVKLLSFVMNFFRSSECFLSLNELPVCRQLKLLQFFIIICYAI